MSQTAEQTNSAGTSAPSFWHTARLFLLSLLAVAVEGALMRLLDTGGLNGMQALALHGSLVTLLLRVTWLERNGPVQANLLSVLTVSTAFLGIIGATGALVTLFLFLYFRRTATPFEEWYRELFPDEEQTAARTAHQLLSKEEKRRDGRVVPFKQVMLYGSLQEKQAVVAMINQRFRPAFAPVLRQAFRDSNNALRVQTASVLARIEGEYMEKSMQLELEKQKNPADTRVLLRYARHFDDYAFTGLLDHERERENRIKATQAYQHLLGLRPDHVDARLGLARIMIRAAQWAAAAVLLEEALAMGQVTPSILVWYFDVLFHLKRYDDLERTLLAHFDLVVHKGHQPQHILDVLHLWGSSCRH
ncbi:MAG: hypothetical protein HQL88_04260 [Magnetococcales bacterium]|nr:hypothetical protein [Magnetococcales bacterium]